MSDDILTPEQVAGRLARHEDWSGTTHWEECWRSHPRCALHQLAHSHEALREQLRDAKPALLRAAERLESHPIEPATFDEADATRADAAALRALVEMGVSDE